MVSASGNILVDDGERNLEEWEEQDGHSLYFGTRDSRYPKIETLEYVFNKEKVKQLIK